MSIARQLLREFRPFFRMLEEPITRSPTSFSLRHRSLFDDPFFNAPALSQPAVDVSEEGNNYVVEADLPGVKKENVEVRIGDGGHSLTIEGKTFSRRSENTTPAREIKEGEDSQASTSAEGGAVAKTESNPLSVERQFVGNTTFTRTIWLPRPVDGSGVAAKLNDGILTVTIPKAKDTASVVVPVE